VNSAAPSPPPAYVGERIKRVPPADCDVMPTSTPVVSFGDPGGARVATLGLNPSRIEFEERGVELDGRLRRFETLKSLGLASLADAPDDLVDRVWQRCASYFDGNPYMKWFSRLEEMLGGVGASYLDGSACHLDLSQWATDPTWNGLQPTARARLVSEDVPFLKEQLRREEIALLLLNGRSVLREVVSHLGVTLRREQDVADGSVNASVYTGTFAGMRVIGWSTNLQSSFGVTREFRQKLRERLAELAAAA